MNERILELAKQAGLKSEIMLDDSSRDVECFVSEYDGSTPSIHYWEKFAKLIVRECIDIVQSQKVFNASYNRKEAIKQDAVLVGHDDCATDTILKFTEHFGVEE